MEAIPNLNIEADYDLSGIRIQKIKISFEYISQILAEYNMIQDIERSLRNDPNNESLYYEYNMHRYSINYFFKNLSYMYEDHIGPLLVHFSEVRDAEKNFSSRAESAGRAESARRGGQQRQAEDQILDYVVHKARLNNISQKKTRNYNRYRQDVRRKLLDEPLDNNSIIDEREDIKDYVKKKRYLKWFYYELFINISIVCIQLGELALYFLNKTSEKSNEFQEEEKYILLVLEKFRRLAETKHHLETRVDMQYGAYIENDAIPFYNRMFGIFREMIKTNVLSNILENKLNAILINKVVQVDEMQRYNFYQYMHIYLDSCRFLYTIRIEDYGVDSDRLKLVLNELILFCQIFTEKNNLFYPDYFSHQRMVCIAEEYLEKTLTQELFENYVNYYVVQVIILQNEFFIPIFYNSELVSYFKKLIYIDYIYLYEKYRQNIIVASSVNASLIQIKSDRKILLDIINGFLNSISQNQSQFEIQISNSGDPHFAMALEKYVDNIKIFLLGMCKYFGVNVSGSLAETAEASVTNTETIPSDTSEKNDVDIVSLCRKLISVISVIKDETEQNTKEIPQILYDLPKLRLKEILKEISERTSRLSKNINEFNKIGIDFNASAYTFGVNIDVVFEMIKNMLVINVLLFSHKVQERIRIIDKILFGKKGQQMADESKVADAMRASEIYILLDREIEELMIKYAWYEPRAKPETVFERVNQIHEKIWKFFSHLDMFYYDCRKVSVNFNKYRNKNVNFGTQLSGNKTVPGESQSLYHGSVDNNVQEYITDTNLKDIKEKIKGNSIRKLTPENVNKFIKIFSKVMPENSDRKVKTDYESRKRLFKSIYKKSIQ